MQLKLNLNLKTNEELKKELEELATTEVASGTKIGRRNVPIIDVTAVTGEPEIVPSVAESVSQLVSQLVDPMLPDDYSEFTMISDKVDIIKIYPKSIKIGPYGEYIPLSQIRTDAEGHLFLADWIIFKYKLEYLLL